jgi:hypothetical protein
MSTLEASRNNYVHKCDVRTEYVSHDEPSLLEAREARQVIQEFARYLISREGNFHFISQLLKYQLCRDESIVSNIYTLLYLLQKKKTQLTYSTTFGVGLWPNATGFQRIPWLEKKIKAVPHHYFNDYISETTTFLTFHIENRNADVFEEKVFRYAFLRETLRSLLLVAKEMDRTDLMCSVLKCSLEMITFNDLC